MTMRSRAARIFALAGLLIGTIAIAAPAHAERYSIDDPNDTKSPNDIHALTYVHGKDRIRFVVKLDDLRRSTGAYGALYLDTKPDDTGPEYILSTGFGPGTDYVLHKVEGWNGDTLAEGLTCDHTLALRYRTDKIVGSFARKCLKNPVSVAMAMKMTDPTTSKLYKDWAPARKSFGLAVAPG